jgi:hypothetical protein
MSDTRKLYELDQGIIFPRPGGPRTTIRKQHLDRRVYTIPDSQSPRARHPGPRWAIIRNDAGMDEQFGVSEVHFEYLCGEVEN